MAGHLTLALIKPHIFFERRTGEIIQRIEKSGFSILLAKMTQLTESGAEQFYAEHQGKDFFEGLIQKMSSGPIWVLVLYKDNAVDEWRKLIGETDPAAAAPGTIRADFGKSKNITDNAVHGSSSDPEAKREINFFFGRELKLAERLQDLR